MSTNAGGREVAYRLFAAEYDDATMEYAESDEERAPNYVITPTGARVNRLFAVGTLTEVTQVNEEMLRARVVDPTGAFVVYAGQYQPDELAFLERVDPPTFVAVTGKARTFQPEDSDQVYTSVRPESIAEVDVDTRDRWVVDAAEQTRERVETYAAAAELEARGDDLRAALRENGLPEGLAAGIPLAQDHYGATPHYLEGLRELARDAVRVVADERDEVAPFDRRPGDAGDGTASFAALSGDREFESAATTTDSTAVADSSPDDAGSGFADADAVESGAEPEESTATVDDAATATEDAADESATEPATDETTTDTTAAAAGTAGNGVDAESAADDDSEPTEPATATAGGNGDAGTLETDAGSVEPDDAIEGDLGTTGEDDADDELGDFESSGLSDEMYEMDEEEREELEAEYGTDFTTGNEIEDAGEADIDVPEPGAEGAGVESEPADDESIDADTEETAADTDEATTESADLESGGPEDDADEVEEPELETEPEDATEPADETPDEAAADADPTDATAVGAAGADAVDADAADEEAAAEESADEEPADAVDEETADEDLEDVDLEEYVVDAMRDLDEGDGAARSDVIATVVEDTGADEDEVEEAIEEALMGGQCYEPDDETLKPI